MLILVTAAVVAQFISLVVTAKLRDFDATELLRFDIIMHRKLLLLFAFIELICAFCPKNAIVLDV